MKKKLAVTIVTQYFHPDESSTGQLMTDLAIELIKKGCDVSVVTGRPSFWKDNRKSLRRENFNGVNIVRVFNTQLDNRNKFGSIINGLSFYFSTFFF